MGRSNAVTVTLGTIDTILTLSVSVSEGRVPLEGTYSGKLTDITGKPIVDADIGIWLDGSFYAYKSTYLDGTFTGRLYVDRVGVFLFGAVFGGGNGYNRSESTPISLVVVPTAKRKTILVLNWGYVDHLWQLPKEIRFEGTLTDEAWNPVNGRTVNLVINDRMVASYVTAGDGKYVFDHTFTEAGTYNVYTSFDGDDIYEGCDAGAAVVTLGGEPPVTPPPTVDWLPVALLGGGFVLLWLATRKRE